MWVNSIKQFSDYLVYEKDVSKYNSRSYLKVLTRFSKLNPLPFTLNHAREFLVTLRRQRLTPAYINYHITVLNIFIRWAVLEGVMKNDFSGELNKLRPKDNRTPDPNDVLSVEETAKLLTNPKNRPIQNPNLTKYFKEVDDMYSLMFSLIYKCGARSGEVINLRKKHLCFTNHSLTFYDTKTGDDRTVAIPPDEEDHLKLYTKSLNDSDYLFVGNHHQADGQPISQEMANRAIKYRAKLVGIERTIHIHMLRHSAITHMLLNGAPLSVVQAIVGHKRLATTQLYTHILVENQREAMLKFNPLIRKTQDVKLIFKRIRSIIEDMRLSEDERLKFQIEQSSTSLKFGLEVVEFAIVCYLTYSYSVCDFPLILQTIF